MIKVSAMIYKVKCDKCDMKTVIVAKSMKNAVRELEELGWRVDGDEVYCEVHK